MHQQEPASRSDASPTTKRAEQRQQHDGTDFITARTLARRWGVTEPTIWRWARAGKIPAPTNVGPQVTRWSRKAIDDHEAANTQRVAEG